MIKLPTSNSWWIFDDVQNRYRKIPRDMDPDSFGFEAEWKNYYGLEIDADANAFSVFLNEDHTEIMRCYIDKAAANNDAESYEGISATTNP